MPLTSPFASYKRWAFSSTTISVPSFRTSMASNHSAFPLLDSSMRNASLCSEFVQNCAILLPIRSSGDLYPKSLAPDGLIIVNLSLLSTSKYTSSINSNTDVSLSPDSLSISISLASTTDSASAITFRISPSLPFRELMLSVTGIAVPSLANASTSHRTLFPASASNTLAFTFSCDFVD